MPHTLGCSPLPKRQQVQGFTDMRQHDYDKATRTEDLDKRAYRLALQERDERSGKQYAYT